MFRSRHAKRSGPTLASLWRAKGAFFVAFALLGCGPLGPIPGGALSGEIGAADHRDWSAAAELANAQLETRPGDPHSVNTWFVALGTRLYVPTSMIRGPKHPEGRSWVAHVAEDDRVRIRLGGTVYERRAIRVPDDSSEYRAVREALEARYGLELDDRDPARTIWIFRLEARAG